MDELELVRLYAKAWNTLAFETIEPYLDDEIVFESQMIFNSLNGEKEVSGYLRGKMATIKKAGYKSKVYAEVGYCGNQAMQNVQVLSAYTGRPCVLMAQGDISEVIALVLLDS